ncbi:hypothetical protein [Nonomuraea guangzhouensis]|uniref:hypothetical protein n=1 Tax=Nonomuraea guangzhouensis TaxID=1291555 RepID=UPI001C606AC4|nr:hypothetical protein [Nonomuraea guangzhouensis]
MFTEVGGADLGGGAVLVAHPPPGVADADAGADREQAAIRTAAQRALIMAASVA